MTVRQHAPLGSPCWVDLWTSDVEACRTFYTALLGWEAQESNEGFGGYFMFTRDGIPVAGAMPGPADVPAANVWSAYLDTDDLARTLETAKAAGATVIADVVPVADLGSMALLADPGGAALGAWQAETFPGFAVLGEPGAPSWFELFTRDHAGAVDFYRSAFHWETDVVGDSDEFRYTTMRDPGGDGELAGIMDASSFLPEGESAHWSVYWEVDDVDQAVARTEELGGSVLDGATDTPHRRIATVEDPAGARFKLRCPPG